MIRFGPQILKGISLAIYMNINRDIIFTRSPIVLMEFSIFEGLSPENLTKMTTNILWSVSNADQWRIDPKIVQGIPLGNGMCIGRDIGFAIGQILLLMDFSEGVSPEKFIKYQKNKFVIRFKNSRTPFEGILLRSRV